MFRLLGAGHGMQVEWLCHAKGQLKRYCDSLVGSSRAWAIEELRKRHPGEFL